MQRYINKKYRLIESDNFDSYLKSMKVRLFYRKMAEVIKPTLKLTEKDGKYYLHTSWGVTDTTLGFRPGLPFLETRVDGIVVKSIVEFQDNRMIHRQICSGKETVAIREFSDRQVKLTLVNGDVVAIRLYDRIHDRSSTVLH